MEIKWTKLAKNDLKDFYDITKMNDPKKYILELIDNVNLLMEQPKLGKIYFYLKGYIIRQLVHKQHRIFYYIEDEKIYIVSIVHHKQNILNKINYIKKYFNNEKQ